MTRNRPLETGAAMKSAWFDHLDLARHLWTQRSENHVNEEGVDTIFEILVLLPVFELLCPVRFLLERSSRWVRRAMSRVGILPHLDRGCLNPMQRRWLDNRRILRQG